MAKNSTVRTRKLSKISFNKARTWLAGQATSFGMFAAFSVLALAMVMVGRYTSLFTESGWNNQNIGPSLIPNQDPTAIACPIEDPILPPSLVPGRGLYVLIDISNSYKHYSQWALDTIMHVLQETLSADDRLTASWIGQDSADPKDTFCCEQPVPQIEVPTLLPVPALPELEQLITADEQASSVQEAQRVLKNTSIIERNNQKIQKYNCDMAGRNKDATQKLTNWRKDQISAIDEFWKAAEPKFNIPRFEPLTNIREAIYRAGVVLQNDDKRQIRYLIVFSDMKETFAPSFTGVHPDLSNVTVIVVLRCTQAADCEQLKSHWDEEFTLMNVQETIFVQESYPEEKLVDLLTRR